MPLAVFLRHIRIALGSLAELDTQLEAAVRLAYLPAPAIVDLLGTMESSRRLLYGLRRAQRKRLGLSVAGTCVVLMAIRLLS